MRLIGRGVQRYADFLDKPKNQDNYGANAFVISR